MYGSGSLEFLGKKWINHGESFIENIPAAQNIEISPKPKTPINDNACIKIIDHDQLYAIKFQGNPVNRVLLNISKRHQNTEK